MGARFKVTNRVNRKPLYRMVVASSRAAAWMMTLCCLMGSRRRAKVIEVLKVWRNTPKRGRPVRTSSPEGYGGSVRAPI